MRRSAVAAASVIAIAAAAAFAGCGSNTPAGNTPTASTPPASASPSVSGIADSGGSGVVLSYKCEIKAGALKVLLTLTNESASATQLAQVGIVFLDANGTQLDSDTWSPTEYPSGNPPLIAAGQTTTIERDYTHLPSDAASCALATWSSSSSS